jgi:hypothetical protein
MAASLDEAQDEAHSGALLAAHWSYWSPYWSDSPRGGAGEKRAFSLI